MGLFSRETNDFCHDTFEDEREKYWEARNAYRTLQVQYAMKKEEKIKWWAWIFVFLLSPLFIAIFVFVAVIYFIPLLSEYLNKRMRRLR